MNPRILEDKIDKFKPEEDESGMEEDDILRSLYKMCRDLTLYNLEDRFKSFLLLLKFDKIEFSSEISRLQMRFIHLVHDEKTSLDADVALLCRLGICTEISGQHRLECLATLFRNSYFGEAYKIAYSMAIEPSLSLKLKRDAIYFLLGSENDEYILNGFLATRKIINDGTYETSQEIIGLLFNIGQEEDLYINILDTTMPYEYNEDISLPLFLDFFYNPVYNIHYKILAAQFIIQTSYSEGENGAKFLQDIYKLAYSEGDHITQGMRGDCGDFLIQWSDNEKYVDMGHKIIDEIKFSNVPIALQNIYTNTENVHDANIRQDINNFIITRLSPNADNLSPYTKEHTLKEISEHIYKIKNENALYKALDSFDRVKTDITKFSKEKVLSVDVLCYIWNYIRQDNQDKSKKKALLNRFMQELVEMADTCTSGHVGRLINVIEGSINITFSQQIVANTQGRINSRLKKLEDETLQEDLVMALMESSEKALKIKLNDWIVTFKDELYTELYEEFVDPGFVAEEEFNISFKVGLKGWIIENENEI